MGLYLVQHGEAVPEPIDPNRPLTKKGKEEVLKVAAFLKGKINVSVIWHSTKLRAKETAGLFAQVILPGNGVLEKQGLAPNDLVYKVKEDILKEPLKNIMIVSHLPFLNKLASLLIYGSEANSCVTFHQAGVVHLDQTDKGNWAVAWIVIPELIDG